MRIMAARMHDARPRRAEIEPRFFRNRQRVDVGPNGDFSVGWPGRSHHIDDNAGSSHLADISEPHVGQFIANISLGFHLAVGKLGVTVQMAPKLDRAVGEVAVGHCWLAILTSYELRVETASGTRHPARSPKWFLRPPDPSRPSTCPRCSEPCCRARECSGRLAAG